MFKAQNPVLQKSAQQLNEAMCQAASARPETSTPYLSPHRAQVIRNLPGLEDLSEFRKRLYVKQLGQRAPEREAFLEISLGERFGEVEPWVLMLIKDAAGSQKVSRCVAHGTPVHVSS